MNGRDALKLGAATCLILLSGAAAIAQAPKMKLTTNIPSSLVTPNKVETRIGTLDFTDGFPDDATVAKGLRQPRFPTRRLGVSYRVARRFD